MFSTVCEKDAWFMTSSSQPTGPPCAAITSNMSSITRSVSYMLTQPFQRKCTCQVGSDVCMSTLYVTTACITMYYTTDQPGRQIDIAILLSVLAALRQLQCLQPGSAYRAAVAHLLVFCSDILDLLRLLQNTKLGLLYTLRNLAQLGLGCHCTQHASHTCMFHPSAITITRCPQVYMKQSTFACPATLR